VPALHDEDEPADSRQVVLILRLVLDGNAQLRRGELLDADAVHQARFHDLGGLLGAVDGWLERQRPDRRQRLRRRQWS
jgi:hypothetical protein